MEILKTSFSKLIFLYSILLFPHVTQSQQSDLKPDRLSLSKIQEDVRMAGFPVNISQGMFGGKTEQGTFFLNVQFKINEVDYFAKMMTIDIDENTVQFSDMTIASESKGSIKISNIRTNYRSLSEMLSESAWPACDRPLLHLRPIENVVSASGVEFTADPDMIGDGLAEATRVNKMSLDWSTTSKQSTCTLDGKLEISGFQTRSVANDELSFDAAIIELSVPNSVVKPMEQRETAQNAVALGMSIWNLQAKNGVGVYLGGIDALDISTKISDGYLLGDMKHIIAVPPLPLSLMAQLSGIDVPLTRLYLPENFTDKPIHLAGDIHASVKIDPDEIDVHTSSRLSGQNILDGSATIVVDQAKMIESPDARIQLLSTLLLEKGEITAKLPILGDLSLNMADGLGDYLAASLRRIGAPGRILANLTLIEGDMTEWVRSVSDGQERTIGFDPEKPVSLASMAATFAIHPRMAAAMGGFFIKN